MNFWIAVPTYWTFPTTHPGKENVVFDHPTPLDQDGDIARMLDSFRCLKGDYKIVIVIGVTNPSLNDAAHQRVREIVKPYIKNVPICIVSLKNLKAFNAALPEPILGLVGYGNIRNAQLAVPYSLGADAVIGIDDDEIIEDSEFLSKVERWIGKKYNGDVVGGMAGPYLDRNGEYRIAGAESLKTLDNIFNKKNYFMNEAIKSSMARAPQDGITLSNVAFGGNMVMHRDTIRVACHDPYIPRGEDYDYVINAKMKGVNFYFQPSMSIIHLPPDSTGSQAADKMSKLIADIRRFIYVQHKMRVHSERYPTERVPMDYVLPYPGPYIDPSVDLAAHAVRALDELYPEFRKNGGNPDALVEDAVQTAKVKADEFFEYSIKWERAIKALENNEKAKRAMEFEG
ncbi:MAG: hypothetical protein ABIH86_03670 [Planctomycetota bacterium]